MVDATLSLQKKTDVFELKGYYFCVLCSCACCGVFCVLLTKKNAKEKGVRLADSSALNSQLSAHVISSQLLASLSYCIIIFLVRLYSGSNTGYGLEFVVLHTITSLSCCQTTFEHEGFKPSNASTKTSRTRAVQLNS